MVTPNLIQPVTIEIRKKSQTTTVYRRQRNLSGSARAGGGVREPVRRVALQTAVSIKGQYRYLKYEEMMLTTSGDKEKTDGYIILRETDLETKSLVLEKGDMITKIGKREVQLMILHGQPTAPYADRGGSTLLKYYFKDKNV